VVCSRFVLGEVRLDRHRMDRSHAPCARARWADFKISEKRVMLINNDSSMGNLTFPI